MGNLIHLQAGHVCGDSTDLLNGKPTGALRVSFGYMSSKTDAEFLLKVIRDVFVDKKLSDQLAPGHHNSIADSQPETTYRLSHLFIYPIKSCQGIKVRLYT
jgi:molybdenum cofactor sulfurtransferase